MRSLKLLAVLLLMTFLASCAGIAQALEERANRLRKFL